MHSGGDDLIELGVRKCEDVHTDRELTIKQSNVSDGQIAASREKPTQKPLRAIASALLSCAAFFEGPRLV